MLSGYYDLKSFLGYYDLVVLSFGISTRMHNKAIYLLLYVAL